MPKPSKQTRMMKYSDSMRKKIFLKELIDNFPEAIYIPGQNPTPFKAWLQNLCRNKPLFLDLGMGTGDFLIGAAASEPESFFLGIEVKKDRIAKALRKKIARKLDNVVFLLSSGEHLKRIGMPKADGIFLLFPDPWPKKRHAKRRMISKEYLKLYSELLNTKSNLFFKTDDPILFEEGLENIRTSPWIIHELNRDFISPEHLRTAYEKRFLEKRKKVHYCSASPSLIIS